MLFKASIRTQALFICAITAIFYCYEYYLRVAPSVISQELMITFNISNAGLGVLSAFFYYAYMPLQIPVGILIDSYGTRIVLTFACLLCVLGTYIFALSDYLLLAQIGRFIVGFGSAFAFVGFLKICANWLPHKYYATMVGFCMLLGMFGAMSGEIVLARLMRTYSWQDALILSAWVGTILTLVIWLIIRDRPKQDTNPRSTEEFTSEALSTGINKSLRSTQIWLSGLIGCCLFLPLSSFAEMWAIPYMQAIGYNTTEAALASSMIFLGFGIGAPLFGMLSNLLRSRRLPLITGSLVSAICAALIILQPNMPSKYMLTTLFTLGLFSGSEVLVFAVGNDITVRSSSGTTTAIINMIVMFGGMILQPVIGVILDIISDVTVSQYQTALLTLPICLLVATGLSFILKESYRD